MIAEKAEESVKQAVAYELQNIVKKYGAVYASNHEGYAVLMEEAEEAEEDLKYISLIMKELWKEIKSNCVTEDFIFSIRKAAVELAKEAVQCAAVCERFLETIKKEENLG